MKERREGKQSTKQYYILQLNLPQKCRFNTKTLKNAKTKTNELVLKKPKCHIDGEKKKLCSIS